MPNQQIASTAFIIVSQSETLARGVCEVVTTMAPNVVIAACGCHDEGLETATRLVRQSVSTLMEHLGSESSIILLADLGAARLAVQQVVTDLGNRAIVMGHGPLVEGATAGVVAAQQGESLSAILRAIASAAQFFPDPEQEGSGERITEPVFDPLAPRTVHFGGKEALGAKPAALLARRASDFDAQITINGVDATSVLALMRLRLQPGDSVTIVANGTEAAFALEHLSQFLQGEEPDEDGSAQLDQEPQRPAELAEKAEAETEVATTVEGQADDNLDELVGEVAGEVAEEATRIMQAPAGLDSNLSAVEVTPVATTAQPVATKAGDHEIIRRIGVNHLPE